MVTNHIQKKIFKQAVDSLCQLCRKENKTISHIVSSCEMLAGTKYTKRHNKICQYLHWCFLQDYNIPINPNWWKHKPKPAVLISNQVLVTYDLKQEVDNAVEANRPDIVVLNEKECRALIIYVTVPMDINMIKAAAAPPKEGTYNPGGYRHLRYSMSKSGWLACSGVTSCKSRPDPKR
eukprot:3690622-Ditylum_brightwellii.AAC.1